MRWPIGTLLALALPLLAHAENQPIRVRSGNGSTVRDVPTKRELGPDETLSVTTRQGTATLHVQCGRDPADELLLEGVGLRFVGRHAYLDGETSSVADYARLDALMEHCPHVRSLVRPSSEALAATAEALREALRTAGFTQLSVSIIEGSGVSLEGRERTESAFVERRIAITGVADRPKIRALSDRLGPAHLFVLRAE